MNTPQAPNRRPDPSPQEQSSQASFIFLDHQGKRWPRLKRIAFIGSLLVFLAAVLFVQTLVLPSSLHLPPSVDQLKSHLKALQMHSTGWTPSKPLWLDYAKQTTHKEKTGGLSHHAKAVSSGTHQQRTTGMTAAAHTIEKEIRLGFYEGWDPDSLDSLTAHEIGRASCRERV